MAHPPKDFQPRSFLPRLSLDLFWWWSLASRGEMVMSQKNGRKSQVGINDLFHHVITYLWFFTCNCWKIQFAHGNEEISHVSIAISMSKWAMFPKKTAGYLPLNPGCLKRGSLCHGVFNNPQGPFVHCSCDTPLCDVLLLTLEWFWKVSYKWYSLEV